MSCLLALEVLDVSDGMEIFESVAKKLLFLCMYLCGRELMV